MKSLPFSKEATTKSRKLYLIPKFCLGMSHNQSQHNPRGQTEGMEYSSTSHTHPSDNSRPRSPSNTNLIEVVSSSLNQSGSSCDDYGHYNKSSYMGDSSFRDETKYHPSEQKLSIIQVNIPLINMSVDMNIIELVMYVAQLLIADQVMINMKIVINIVMYEGFQVTGTMIKIAAVNKRMYLMVRTETAIDTGRKVVAVNIMKMSEVLHLKKNLVWAEHT